MREINKYGKDSASKHHANAYYPFGTSPWEHPHKHCTRGSVLGFCHRPDFSHVGILVWLPLLKHVDMIGAHFLLSNENLFAPIDNEIPPLIIRTLSKLCQILLGILIQRTVARPEHYRNLKYSIQMVQNTFAFFFFPLILFVCET